MFVLSVMFRMYDTDKNGFLDQVEMDSIIDQMMTVADYMGWETNELRPVSLFAMVTDARNAISNSPMHLPISILNIQIYYRRLTCLL